MDKNKINKIYQQAIDRLNNAPNNTEFRLKTERELIKMKQELDLGLITYEEYYDLEWFYFETWVDPITLSTSIGEVILN